MATTVINIKTRAYFDVYIGRGRSSVLGNPFKIGRGGDRAEVIAKYREYFYERLGNDPEFKAKILRLKGKVLGCQCKPLDCHGGILVEYLDNG